MTEEQLRTDRERELISRLLNKQELLPLVSDSVKPEYFADDFCREVFAEMLKQGKFSRISLEKNGFDRRLMVLLEGETVTCCTTRSQIEAAAWMVIEHYKQAELRRSMAEMQSDGNVDLQKLQSRIAELNLLNPEKAETENPVEDVFVKADRLYRGEADPRNLPTGFASIDGRIEGVQNSELVIIGGRPGSGKTTIAVNIAVNQAKRGKKILFFSLEMAKSELIERIVISLTGNRVSPRMSPAEINRWLECVRYVERLPLTINDKAGMTVEGIYSAALKKKDREGLDAVFIDNLSILKSSRIFKNRYEEVSEISRQLKVMAKDLDVPVVCLSQLNRALEARTMKAPTLADLRDSGSIEQDADMIAFVYRPEYHLAQAEPDDKMSAEYSRWLGTMEKVRGKGVFIVAKNRRGELANIELKFNGYQYRFTEAA